MGNCLSTARHFVLWGTGADDQDALVDVRGENTNVKTAETVLNDVKSINLYMSCLKDLEGVAKTIQTFEAEQENVRKLAIMRDQVVASKKIQDIEGSLTAWHSAKVSRIVLQDILKFNISVRLVHVFPHKFSFGQRRRFISVVRRLVR